MEKSLKINKEVQHEAFYKKRNYYLSYDVNSIKDKKKLAAEIDKLTPGFTLEQLTSEAWLTDTTNKTILANTGANYTSSLVALSSLLIVAAGAAIVMSRNKKQA